MARPWNFDCYKSILWKNRSHAETAEPLARFRPHLCIRLLKSYRRSAGLREAETDSGSPRIIWHIQMRSFMCSGLWLYMWSYICEVVYVYLTRLYSDSLDMNYFACVQLTFILLCTVIFENLQRISKGNWLAPEHTDFENSYLQQFNQ